MRLFMYKVGFKIRSKKDAEHFLSATDSYDFGRVEQEVYWHDDVYDYCLYPKSKEVGERPIWARGNIFHPYLIETDPVETIWKTRKYINAQLFTEEGW